MTRAVVGVTWCRRLERLTCLEQDCPLMKETGCRTEPCCDNCSAKSVEEKQPHWITGEGKLAFVREREGEGERSKPGYRIDSLAKR